MQHEHVSFQGRGSSKHKTTNGTLQVDEVKVEELVQAQDVHVEAHRGTILALHHCHQFRSSSCGTLKCERYVAASLTSTYKKIFIFIVFPPFSARIKIIPSGYLVSSNLSSCQTSWWRKAACKPGSLTKGHSAHE